MMNLLSIFLVSFYGFFQIPMADQFRQDGKIYVVVGVILILLVGFFVFLWRMDRRVKKLEEKANKEG